MDVVDIGWREGLAEGAFEIKRAEEGWGGVVAGLLRAESTKSLLLFPAALLLLFPLTEKAAAAAALVGAPKLEPTVFAPPTNTEFAVLPLLTVRRWMVEGNPNPKMLRFFCATLPYPSEFWL